MHLIKGLSGSLIMYYVQGVVCLCASCRHAQVCTLRMNYSCLLGWAGVLEPEPHVPHFSSVSFSSSFLPISEFKLLQCEGCKQDF
jgi:hypothetical protein